MVTLDQLVPRDHLLRLVDTPIRFDFIREKTEGLYCLNNGRPAIDPVMLFKMSFIGYLFGVRSERQLVRELEVNVAYEHAYLNSDQRWAALPLWNHFYNWHRPHHGIGCQTPSSRLPRDGNNVLTLHTWPTNGHGSTMGSMRM